MPATPDVVGRPLPLVRPRQHTRIHGVLPIGLHMQGAGAYAIAATPAWCRPALLILWPLSLLLSLSGILA